MSTAWRKVAGGLLAMGWIALLLATLLAGCANRGAENADAAGQSTAAVQQAEEQPQAAGAESGATTENSFDDNATREGGVVFEGDSVTITLDADTLSALGGGPEDFTGAGFTGVEATADGGVALTMTAARYEEMMAELREGILAELAAIAADEGEYPSVQSITANRDFTLFTMVVEREGYEAGAESVVEMLLSIYSITWQVYAGGAMQPPTFSMVDAASGEEYDRFSVAA